MNILQDPNNKTTFTNKFPIKEELIPQVAGKFISQRKGTVYNDFLILYSGEIYRATAPENTIIVNLRKNSSYNILYAVFLSSGVGPENKAGLLFRHLQISVRPIDRSANADARPWFEHNHSGWFPFILCEDGKIFAEDGISPKFSAGEGRFYNKTALQVLKSIYCNNLREHEPSQREMKKFITHVAIDRYPTYPDAYAWEICQVIKKLKPRGSKKQQIFIEKIKSSPWVNPFVAKNFEDMKVRYKNPMLSRCWICDPKEDTKDKLILHLISFYNPRQIEEEGRFYWEKGKDPIILIKEGSFWDKKTLMSHYPKDYYEIIPEHKFNSILGQAIAAAKDINKGIKFWKEKTFHPLIKEGKFHTIQTLGRLNLAHLMYQEMTGMSPEKFTVDLLGDDISRETIENSLKVIYDKKDKTPETSTYVWRQLDTWMIQDLIFFYKDELKVKNKIPLKEILEFLVNLSIRTENRYMDFFLFPWRSSESSAIYAKGKEILKALVDIYISSKSFKEINKILLTMKIYLDLVHKIIASKGINWYKFDTPKTLDDIEKLTPVLGKVLFSV